MSTSLSCAEPRYSRHRNIRQAALCYEVIEELSQQVAFLLRQHIDVSMVALVSDRRQSLNLVASGFRQRQAVRPPVAGMVMTAVGGRRTLATRYKPDIPLAGAPQNLALTSYGRSWRLAVRQAQGREKQKAVVCRLTAKLIKCFCINRPPRWKEADFVCR